MGLTKEGSDWEMVEEWPAKGGRGEQEFKLTAATLHFTKFIRLDFIGHHGSAYYCPVTTVKVFGKTMIEEYVEDEECGNSSCDSLRVITTGRRALATVPTALPLATIMELEGRCQAAPTSNAQSSDRSSENVFKAINERLGRLERHNAENEELRAQLDGLARIILNMAGREHRINSSVNFQRLPHAGHFMNGVVGRCEFYSVIFTMIMLALSLLYIWRRPNRPSFESDRRHSLQNEGTMQSPPSPVPLDLPNSDYLGMARTPVDSAERGQSPVTPSRSRRQSMISKP